jgi:exonuclease III
VSKKISISGWNVNGLFQKVNETRVSKLDDIYFKHSMKSDIIFLSETHLSCKDPIVYEGYKCFSNCRSKGPSRKRGGLAVLIKRTILNGISLIDKSVPDIMWFKLDSKVFGFKKDLYICFYTSHLLTLLIQ